MAGLIAGAPVSPIVALSPGISVNTAVQRLTRAGATAVRTLDATTPQAMSEALFERGLLEVLQKFAAVPVTPDSGELSAAAFQRFVLAEHRGQRIVAAFGRSGLRFALTTMSVPIDARADPRGEKGASPNRIGARRRALSALLQSGLRMSSAERDRWGNTFTWRGRGVRAWHVPERDELRVLRLAE